MRTIAVIPCRFESKRLPGKPLLDIHGKSLVQRVYERACLAKTLERVIVATDDARILTAVEAFGGDAVLTSPSHESGTDRVAEAAAELDVELVVNVQGDEPLIDPAAIDAAVALARSTPGAIVSLMSPIRDEKLELDPNVVKVVTDLDGFALYFSRATIPAPARGRRSNTRYFQHIGLYVYPKRVLAQWGTMSPTPLEQAERLEQLRALENGLRIRMQETPEAGIGVDTKEDLERVRQVLSKTVAVE